MKLNYESIDANIAGAAQYNGNISQQMWATSTTVRHAYGYSYDEMNQLLSAEYEKYVSGWNNDPGKYNESATYDLNGNIKTLGRYAGAMVDNLTFTLDGNRLLGSDDALANTAMALDFEDRESIYSTSNIEYIYDANGNLIEDKNKKIKVRYNFMNLPVSVVFDNSGDSINWFYAASGQKLQKVVYDDGVVIKTLDYVSGFDYTNGALDFFYCEQGRVKKQTDGSLRHEYNLADHLGNSRVFFTDVNNDGTPEVIQESHYYAFGLRIEGLGVQNDNKYLYNGKELTDDFGLNWYEYGWRMYDAEIGRWHQVDPMDEFMSPYCYVGNNPINLTDPDGSQTGGDLTEEQIADLPSYEAPEIVIEAERLPRSYIVPRGPNGGMLAPDGTEWHFEPPIGGIRRIGMKTPQIMKGLGRLAEWGGNWLKSVYHGYRLSKYADDVLAAANKLDPADKGGLLTKAGRALDKHGTNVAGNQAARNSAAGKIIQDILNHPDRVVNPRTHSRLGEIMEVTSPTLFQGNIRGFRVSADFQSFIGFIQ